MARNHWCVLILLLYGLCYGQEGVVVDVKFQGNKKTHTDFLKTLAKLKPGMALDSVAMQEDILRLRRLPSVSHAYFQVFEANASGEYNVFYNIEENFTLIPFASVYTSNNDEFAFRVGLQEFNFLGRTITLGGFYQYDIFFILKIGIHNIYAQPYEL